MASLQRFDGPSLEDVLAEVQAAHGDSARILNAHRVRAGGIGGFFARERFEVEVEVDDEGDGVAGAAAAPAGAAAGASPGPGPAAGRTPTSILDLADDVSSRESGPPATPAPASFASLLAARLATEHARSTLDAGRAVVEPAGPDGSAATGPRAAGPAAAAAAGGARGAGLDDIAAAHGPGLDDIAAGARGPGLDDMAAGARGPGLDDIAAGARGPGLDGIAAGARGPGLDDIAAVFRADVAAPLARRLQPSLEPPAVPHPGVAAAVAASVAAAAPVTPVPEVAPDAPFPPAPWAAPPITPAPEVATGARFTPAPWDPPPAEPPAETAAAIPPAAAITAPAPVAPVATPPPVLVAGSDAAGSYSATRTPATVAAPATSAAPAIPPAAPLAPAPAVPVAPAPEALVADSDATGSVPATRTAVETPAETPAAPAAAVPAPAVPFPATATAPSLRGAAGAANLRLPALAPLFEVDPFVARLTRRGLPVSLVPSGRVEDVRAAVVALLAQLPAAPTVPAGRPSVVVTVGDREEAYALARRIGSEHGVDDDHVVLASPTYRGRRIPAWARLATVEEAVSERRAWRRRAGVTVVAVEAPVDGHTTEWAAGVLAALEPNLTWGVVSAGRKTEDVAWWMERLGGVDALAVEGARHTMTPGSVLSLGVPVGLLDGERPTAETWADLVLAGADR